MENREDVQVEWKVVCYEGPCLQRVQPFRFARPLREFGIRGPILRRQT